MTGSVLFVHGKLSFAEKGADQMLAKIILAALISFDVVLMVWAIRMDARYDPQAWLHYVDSLRSKFPVSRNNSVKRHTLR